MADDYSIRPDDYRKGAARFDFQQGVYSSNAVKAALRACHHEKCCYCETVIPVPHAYPQVEHYRPKSAVLQDPGDQALMPGYYWLAYDWDNLLLSCVFCNSRKRHLFPLSNPASRARDHTMDEGREKPLLLKPDRDDPALHLEWRQELPVGKTARGVRTVDVLALDSPAHEPRLTHYSHLVRTCEMVRDHTPSKTANDAKYAQQGRNLIAAWLRPDQAYSAMTAAHMAANPLPAAPSLLKRPRYPPAP